MTKKDYQLDWRSKFQKSYDLYGGKLGRLFNFTNKDIGVYLFLVIRKWYSDQAEFSKNAITNELNGIPAYFVPDGLKTTYSPQTVEKSLIKLEHHGFIKKCKNSSSEKPKHRSPDYVYESTEIAELRTKIEKELQETKNDIIGMLRQMEYTEEDSFLVKSKGVVQNDK